MKKAISKIIHDSFNDLVKICGISGNTLAEYQSLINTKNIEANIIEYPHWDTEAVDIKRPLTLKDEYQDQLFKSVFLVDNDIPIYNYTSYEKCLKILQSGELSLGCIIGMNDKSEIDYYDIIFDRKIILQFHLERMRMFNERFILSCSLLPDNLNNWRLYGRDGKGTCLKFEVNEKYNGPYKLVLGKVLYGKTFAKKITSMLSRITKTFKCRFYIDRIGLWKNFMKSEDYEHEKEVRLLFFNNSEKSEEIVKPVFKVGERYGLLTSEITFRIFEKDFPIKLKEIILGPKVPEVKINEKELKYYIKHVLKINDIKVNTSAIDHYR